ncbi:hypothetical protein BHE74_00031152 [Ensete ventricosum]|nr:hypothetical protein GW17_00041214 [Ensete ventricosum]RWW61767.1 hypothetical protein BHE74_00031152 [Ensete ventricosum]RZS01062.1 hypothetical protein BHM03_00030858 [Ensete ventricosum]
MERHDPFLTSTRVHVLDLCPRKALCLCSIFHLLCRPPSCGFDTSPTKFYLSCSTPRFVLS